MLLPVRDAETTLELCLRSIARQSERDFECVVVDDGSRDGSASIVRRFAERDSRFQLHLCARRGIVSALAWGLRHCRASYVARMDADDLMHRDRLRLQATALDAHRDWDGLGCHVRLFPRAGLRCGLRQYEAWLSRIDSAEAVEQQRFIECPLPHPTWMFRHSLFREIAYRDGEWPEDYDLLLRAIASGRRLGVIARRLLAWREGPSRLWRRDPRYGQDRFQACKAHYVAEGPLRNHAEYLLWGYGETGKALRRALAAHGRTPAFIIDLHPGRIGERIHGAPVVRPEAITGLPRIPLLVSVAGPGARHEIGEVLRGAAFCEGRDFFFAA